MTSLPSVSQVQPQAAAMGVASTAASAPAPNAMKTATTSTNLLVSVSSVGSTKRTWKETCNVNRLRKEFSDATPAKKVGVVGLMCLLAVGVAKLCGTSKVEIPPMPNLPEMRGQSPDQYYKAHETFVFRDIFADPAKRLEFGNFLNNIFIQVNENEYNSLIEEVMKTATTDAEIYHALTYRIGEAKAGMIGTQLARFDSLTREVADTAEQIAQIMGIGTVVRGYTEIGFPGRYVDPFKTKLDMRGPVVVINYAESAMDRLQTGLKKPYDKFVALNDFNTISESDIPSQSMDMVSCLIGLHHTPLDKLDAFVESIKRILRPGGSFILRDHDAHNTTSVNMASMAHTTFNVGNGVSLGEELEEYRNFQGLDYWIELMKKHGFMQYSQPMMRYGDPTLNSLIRFIKVPTPTEQRLLDIKGGLEISPTYWREPSQTFLTSTEWRDVDAAQEEADCEKDPHCIFPYSEYAKQYQSISDASLKAAQDHYPWGPLPSSDYTFMDSFIRSKGVAENRVKSVEAGIAAKVWSTIGPEKDPSAPPSEMKEYLIKTKEEYAKFVTKIPFYNFPFMAKIPEFWKITTRSNGLAEFVENAFISASKTTEFVIKGLASLPIGGFYTAEENLEPEVIQLIVRDPSNKLGQVDDRIKVLRSIPENEFKLVSMPRYMPFKEIWLKLAQAEGVDAVEIAGQTQIQVKLKVPSNVENPCEGIKGCEKLYEWPVLTDPKIKYIAMNVQVGELRKVLKALQEKGVEVPYIHDF